MKHQTEIYEGEPLNFEMVYRRYHKFSSQNSTVQNVEKPIVLKAFEHLKVRSYYGNMFSSLTEAHYQSCPVTHTVGHQHWIVARFYRSP
jgi:hypothetical protein